MTPPKKKIFRYSIMSLSFMESNEGSKGDIVPFIISEIIGEPSDVELDLDDLPLSLIYKLEDIEYTFAPEKFGFNKWKQLDWYERRMPAGLLEQWPCLYFMVEDMWRVATQRTPLEEIEMKQKGLL